MAAPSPREAGKAAFNRGDYAAAVEHYTAALRQEPASDILFCNRSLAHLEAGAPEAALRDALSATTLRPDSVKGWYRKGAALQALGRARAAVVALEQAAAVAPGDEQVQSRLAQARGAAASERGAASEAAGQQRVQLLPHARVQTPPVAPPMPQQQQPQQPQNAQASSAVLRSLLGITQPDSNAGGKAAAKRGGGKKSGIPAPKAAPEPKPPKRVMWADEVEEFEELAAAPAQPAAAAAASSAAAFAARGAAAFHVADFAAALSFYTEALGMRPNDAQLLCNRSAAAHGLGLFDAAYADAIAAVAAAPERGKCHVRAGTAAAALQRWPEAAAAYERALVIAPGADDARQRLAMVQAAMMAETASSAMVAREDLDTPSRVEEAHEVSTPPGLSPEPARASDSDECGEHGVYHGSACVAVPEPACAAETDADAAALAAALATAARCSDALSAKAAALARRVEQLEAELAAARGARCGHCGRCGLASS